MEKNTSNILMVLTGVVVLFLLFEVMVNMNKVNQLDLPKPVPVPVPVSFPTVLSSRPCLGREVPIG